jgi:hypothetical protein
MRPGDSRGRGSELDPISLVAELHDEVAGLLGGLLSGGVRRDAGDADAPGRVFHHGQDVCLGAVEQVDRAEVARQDRGDLDSQAC